MPKKLYICRMNAAEFRTVNAAQDAAEALVALGWPVSPVEDDRELWRIGDFEMTDEELIDLATWRGIQAAVERVQ